MKRRVPQAVSLCLIAGLIFPGAQGFPASAAETEVVTEADGGAASEASESVELTDSNAEAKDSDSENAEASLEGELIFAQCEDYVNIRSESSTDGEITAKIYNNGSATVLSVVEDSNGDGEWYEITSGNAYGYVKADYFATGEEAESIAEEIAYNVATVQVEYLNIRAEASTDSEVIDVAPESAQIEVVLYGEDWMKVALGNDVYGYIKAEYVEYDTYYPVAETLEEEEARLIAENVLSEETASEAQTEAEAVETEAAQTETEAAQTEAAQAETKAAQTEAVQAETETNQAVAAQTETEAAQTEAAQAETEATQTEAVQAETEAAQTETEAAQTETAQAETEAAQTETEAEQTEAETTQTETEAAQTEAAQTETEAAQTETESGETEAAQTETESSQTEAETSSTASTGSSIASYALQFVGNPYVYGGTSLTNGADCSGFVQSVFAHFGIYLSRTAAGQAANGTVISTSELQAGDLLFYCTDGSTIDHVAIYIGSGMIVHAANSTRGICTDSAYYATPVCAVRCY